MLAILSDPFLPNASKKIKEIINLKDTKWTEINIDNPILNSQNKINKPELIFRKIEDEEIENQIEKLKA
jgi:methionyl-tRNA synthetase